MQINVTSRHGHLSEEAQKKVNAKVEKLTRIFDRVTAIEVVVDLKEAGKPRVDIKVDAEHKHDFIAHDQGESLMTIVESVIKKMEVQLRRYKEKIQEKHRDPNVKRQEVESDSEADATLGDDNLSDD